MAFLTIATLLPLAFLLIGTFMKLFGFFGLPNGTYTLEHWNRVVTDPIFIDSVRNSLMLGGGAALLARRRFLGRCLRHCPHALQIPYGAGLHLVAAVGPSSGVLLGLGMLWMVLSIPIFRPLHTSTIVLRSWP